MSDLASGRDGLAAAIQARFELARDPQGFEDIRPELNKKAAPGLAESLFNVATANLAVPFSGKAAEKATESDLEKFAIGGGDPGAHATAFGAAAAGGDLAGQTGLYGATAGLGGVSSVGGAESLANMFRPEIAPAVTEGARAAVNAASRVNEVFPSRAAAVINRLRGLASTVAPAADRVATEAAKTGLDAGTRAAGAGAVGDLAFGPEDGRDGVSAALERTAARFGTGL
ncbi:MAG: hypothetical protein ACRD16_14310, partial [Thermoanaerobaculia bacterium]